MAGMWQRRSNKELEHLYGEANIVQVVKGNRMRWMGHVTRMNQDRLPRKILERSLGARKRRGRPRARWQEEVKKDMREAGITDWREKTKDKKGWRRTVNQAMGLLGPEC